MTSLNSFCFAMNIIFMLPISIALSQNKPDKPFFTSLKAMCDNTLYPNTCYDTLFPLIDSDQNNYDSQFLYNISVQVAMDEISRVHANLIMSTPIFENIYKNTFLPSALESCRDFLSLALYNLNQSLLTNGSALTTREARTNFRTWISGAGADLQTCKDDTEYAPTEIRKLVTSELDKSTKLVTISLAIISKIDDNMSSTDWESNWLSPGDKKLIHSIKKTIEPDVVVAKDGSGKYKTIAEAINDVPPQSSRRYVIYVKKGVYNEYVKVDKKKWNVLMYGDGMDDTIVSGNRSHKDGLSTSLTATFAAYGKGFIAKDIGFVNTAGPANHQAVALMSTSDRSVFYRCLFDGYQDTLYTHHHRQFYRECKIYGTTDFIFGDAAVVIQNSDILVRKPLKSKTTIVTAQGKLSPYSKTGISIQNCSIMAAEDLGLARTFLGRPWRNYSTVVVMESKLGSLIDPKGWLPWHKNTTAPDTIFYVEHGNVGPGANTDNRVKWKGLRVKDTQNDATNFTVRSLIDGDQWLPATGVPFQADL